MCRLLTTEPATKRKKNQKTCFVERHYKISYEWG